MPSQSIPTTVACKFKTPSAADMAFTGPAGEMNGGSADFTVAFVLRSRNPATTASLSAAETIGCAGDGATTGWRLGRDAAGNLKFSVWAAAGASVANLSTPFPGALVFLLLRVTGGSAVEGFVNGAFVDSDAIVGNCLPAATGVVLGDSQARDEPCDHYDVVAFGYAAEALADEAIAQLAEAARINGHLEPSGGQALELLDYIFQADDLCDPANPGGFGSEVSEEEVEVTDPIGLSTWQQVTALMALQPTQARPATSTTVLSGKDSQGVTATPLLPAAALSF